MINFDKKLFCCKPFFCVKPQKKWRWLWEWSPGEFYAVNPTMQESTPELRKRSSGYFTMQAMGIAVFRKRGQCQRVRGRLSACSKRSSPPQQLRLPQQLHLLQQQLIQTWFILEFNKSAPCLCLSQKLPLLISVC